MTPGEYATIFAIVGGLIAIGLGMLAAYSEKSLTWVVLLAVLLTGAVSVGAYYVMPAGEETVIKKRYRERVLHQYKKCADECVDKCFNEAAKKIEGKP